MNIDKITTLNSCYSYSDLVSSGTECSVEYWEHRRNAWEQRIIYEQEREKQRLEYELERKEYEIQREKERLEAESTLRELREYRERLNAREEELARNRRIREEESRQIYLGGSNHGQYIITSRGKVRVG